LLRQWVGGNDQSADAFRPGHGKNALTWYDGWDMGGQNRILKAIGCAEQQCAIGGYLNDFTPKRRRNEFTGFGCGLPD
jgi:hypothetical protein